MALFGKPQYLGKNGFTRSRPSSEWVHSKSLAHQPKPLPTRNGITLPPEVITSMAKVISSWLKN
jgi:hypothetical protein